MKMIEGTSIQHLDEFNYIIMDLNDINIKLYNEDQNLIALCSLAPLYDIFIDTLLYRKDNISLDDVSNALKLNELKRTSQIIKQKKRVWWKGEEHKEGIS